MSNSWNGGFVGQVSVYNDSMKTDQLAAAAWTFTKGEKLDPGWNSVATQSGTASPGRTRVERTIEHVSVSFDSRGPARWRPVSRPADPERGRLHHGVTSTTEGPAARFRPFDVPGTDGPSGAGADGADHADPDVDAVDRAGQVRTRVP